MPAHPRLRSAALLSAMAACLLLLHPVSASLPVKASPAAIEAYQSAEGYLARRDWRPARVELMNAVAADGNWPEARLALAETALQLFDPITAREQLDKVGALGVPRSRYAHLLAHVEWMEGRPADAIATIAADPVDRRNGAYAARILGRAQMDMGDSAAASATFDRALQIWPDDSLLWTEIGRLRMVIANKGGAIEALDRAVALDPANVRALELRGRLVRSQFGLAAAIPWFERGLQIDPNDVPLLEEYAATLGDLGRNRDMLAQARRILSLDNRNPRAYYMPATLAARAGNYRLAHRLIDKIADGYAALPGPQLLRAICEYELGNFNHSVDILARLASAQPRNGQVAQLLARALHRSGDQDGARAALVPLLEGSYSSRLLGRIEEARGRRDLAAGPLDAAYFPSVSQGRLLRESTPPAAAAQDAARNPASAPAVIPHIRHLLANGQIAEARSATALLVQGNDGVADAQILAGDISRLAGDDGAAISAYEKARAVQFSRGVMQRLAAAYRAEGQSQKAGDVIAAYLAYNPSDMIAARMLGYHLIDRGDWAGALPWLLKARLRIGWGDAALNANIARTLSGLGRNAEALRMARLAYRADPANAMTTRVYGNMLLKSGEVRAARDLLRKAAKLMPEDREVAAEYKAAIATER